MEEFNQPSKISIRFFNDKEVRAAWDYDGKRYLTDCLPQNEMLNLVEATPSPHAIAFARWLITGENQIDSKSRDKAYQLWDSSLLQTIED